MTRICNILNILAKLNYKRAGAALTLCVSVATGAWAQPTLYSFSGPDGSNPVAGLVQGFNGNLWRTTLYGGPTTAACPPPGCGEIFQITPGTVALLSIQVFKDLGCRIPSLYCMI